LLEELDGLWQRQEAVEKKLDDLAQAGPASQLLETTPGVGRRTAEVVAAYLDEPKRFRSGREVSAYSGLVPRQYQIEVEPELGGDYHLIAERSEGFPHELFVDVRFVNLGGVEERDAAFHGCAEKRCHLLLVFRRAVGKAHPHAAKSKGGHFQIALSKFSLLHCGTPYLVILFVEPLEQMPQCNRPSGVKCCSARRVPKSKVFETNVNRKRDGAGQPRG